MLIIRPLRSFWAIMFVHFLGKCRIDFWGYLKEFGDLDNISWRVLSNSDTATKFTKQNILGDSLGFPTQFILIMSPTLSHCKFAMGQPSSTSIILGITSQPNRILSRDLCHSKAKHLSFHMVQVSTWSDKNWLSYDAKHFGGNILTRNNAPTRKLTLQSDLMVEVSCSP